MSKQTERRRRVVRATAPAFGLLAAGLLVWQGSYAAFSAATPNTANAWSTGKLALTNNGGTTTYAASTAGIFNETLAKPGSGNAKCLTVESTGTLAGSLHAYRGVITGTNSANLAAALTVTVDAVSVPVATNVASNCTGYTGGTAGALYSGTLAAMPATYALSSGTALTGAATERVAYRISWSLPLAVSDNTLMSSNAVADLNFEVQ